MVFGSAVTPKERFPQRKQFLQFDFIFPPKQLCTSRNGNKLTFAIEFVFCVIFVKIWQTPKMEVLLRIVQFWLALPTLGFLALTL